MVKLQDIKNHLSVTGEFLFWQPHMGSLSYGRDSMRTTAIQGGRVKSPRFYSDRAQAHWNVHFNLGDVGLGRNYFAGRWLSLRHFFGVRTIFINPNYQGNYERRAVAICDIDKVRITNDFWRVGLRMGGNSLWEMGRCFSLFDNGFASPPSGHVDVQEREKLIKAGFQKMHIDSNVNNIAVDADVSLRLKWDYMFSKNRYHFGIKMGREFDPFFNQNQLFNFVGTTSSSLKSQNDDLAFQGLTLGFRFDF